MSQGHRRRRRRRASRSGRSAGLFSTVTSDIGFRHRLHDLWSAHRSRSTYARGCRVAHRQSQRDHMCGARPYDGGQVATSHPKPCYRALHRCRYPVPRLVVPSAESCAMRILNRQSRVGSNQRSGQNAPIERPGSYWPMPGVTLRMATSNAPALHAWNGVPCGEPSRPSNHS